MAIASETEQLETPQPQQDPLEGHFYYTYLKPEIEPTEVRDYRYVTASKVQEFDSFTDLDESSDSSRHVWQLYEVETGDVIIVNEDEIDIFAELNTGIAEYQYYSDSCAAVDYIVSSLPEGQLKEGFRIAMRKKLREMVDFANKVKSGESQSVTIESIHNAQRDLYFMLASISNALRLHNPAYFSADIADTSAHTWYTSGKKMKSNGFVSEYRVCNDTFNDEGDQDELHLEEDELDPDEYHYPGKLEIRVDPLKRIEFVYTPEKESARSRHNSHAVVTHDDGRQREYSNSALSIRIDYDDLAPKGISVDVARSSYEGSRNGRHIVRNADLVGEVLEYASDTNSHEYTGLTDDMREEFPAFAEGLALQLYLQSREYKDYTARTTLGRVAFSKAA